MYCQKCGKTNPADLAYCGHCGTKILTQQIVPASARTSSPTLVPVLIGLLIGVGIVGIALFIYLNANNHTDTQFNANVYVSNSNWSRTDANYYADNGNAPVNTITQHSIVNSTFPVGSSSYHYYPFTLPSSSHVSGHFRASGGANDIEVLLVDQDGYENFINHHSADTYYRSTGYVTRDRINVNLSAGNYVLIFSNTAALLTNKVVTANVHADY
jgi:hypothetical protein